MGLSDSCSALIGVLARFVGVTKMKAGLLLGLLGLSVILQGCETATKPSSQIVQLPAKGELVSYRSSKVHAVSYAAPRFSGASGASEGVTAPQSALEAIVQYLLVEKLEEKSGEGLVRKLSLEDPAIKIRDRISSTLSSEIGWRDMQIESIYSGDDSINALKARFVDGIVLDVRTTFWGLRITEEYEFGYQTRGRLLDLFSSKVIWEGTCSYAELNKDFGNLISWTGDIDLASGEKLKQAAMRAAKYCSEQFIYQITETK